MPKTITGYAIRYSEETVIAGLFREKIAPGAFDRSLREHPDVLSLLDHDPGRIIGRTASGTLELRSDRIGLWFAVTPDPDAPDGATALSAVERQDIAGCSFGFSVEAESWDEGGDDELPLRTVERARLYETSLVGWPAYPTTSASIMRAADDKKAERNQLAASRRRAEAAMRARGII